MKIFGVGFPRTGTSSLARALTVLGYPTKHQGRGYASRDVTLNDAIRFINTTKFEAYTDFPWAIFYQEWDNRFPKSKFILTERDVDSWYESYHWLVGNQKPTGFREWYFGNRDWKEVYLSHNQAVKDYFDGSNKLLVMHISEGWEPICKFLGIDVRKDEFPHLNKRGPGEFWNG